MMIKLNKKLKCTSHKSPKVKVPKIEINECKVKTKDQKKLENEMFQQAKEARSLLDKLLIEDGSTPFEGGGRIRANSLNATVENLILSTHATEYTKLMSPRGSVPTIPTIYKRIFSKKNSPLNSNSPSPSSSPEPTNRRIPEETTIPCDTQSSIKPSRKYEEVDKRTTNNSVNSICHSPQTKRVCESTPEIETSTSEINDDDESTAMQIETDHPSNDSNAGDTSL